MELFTVVDKQTHIKIDMDRFKDNSFNILTQWHNKEYEMLDDYPNIKILIDSGAFGANVYGNVKTTEEMTEYADRYIDFIKSTSDDNRIVGYFEMDFLTNGLGYIKHLRRKLFNVSDKIIPVFHSVYGIREYERMCDDYDYISVCNRDGINPKGFKPLVQRAHQSGCKVHGLGINDDRLLRVVPFDSVDSSTWVYYAYWDYYLNKNIDKTSENNKKWRPLYERKAFLEQLNRQKLFHDHWKDYNTLRKQL